MTTIGSNKGGREVAKKVIINYDDDKVPGFNLSFSVGIGGQNDQGDLLLIQALFNFIATGLKSVSRFGISGRHDLPAVTGRLDSNTIFTIIGFQHKQLHRLFATKSGTLFPADYTQKIPVVMGEEPRQPMFLLHQFAQEAAALLNEADYTTAMVKLFPELKP